MKYIIHKKSNESFSKTAIPEGLTAEQEAEFFNRKVARIEEKRGPYAEHVIMEFDSDPLPEGFNLEQCYIENGELKTDQNWDRMLMPFWKIRSDFINDTKKEIDDELEKESPDLVKIKKLERDLEKNSRLSQKEYFQMAIENLDKRISDGKSDKSIVRQKILDKIDEINLKEGA